METRKIQQVGGGTFTVSLPKSWARSQGLEAGSVVNLHTHIDGLLVVQSPDASRDDRARAVLDVASGDRDRIEQLVRAAYAAGCEEIVLEATESFSREQRRAVERITENLIGGGLVTESATRMTVRTLLDADEVSIRQSIRQLRFVVTSMHRDATEALVSGRAGGLADRDDEADRLFAMIDRHFGRGLSRLDEVDALGLTRPELFELRSLARELERVADHAERIGTIAGELSEPLDLATAADVETVARSARGIVDDAASSLDDDADPTGAQRALQARERLQTDLDTLERRLFEASDADYRLTFAVDSIRRTAEHGGNIAELALRSAMRRGDRAPESVDEDATAERAGASE